MFDLQIDNKIVIVGSNGKLGVPIYNIKLMEDQHGRREERSNHRHASLVGLALIHDVTPFQMSTLLPTVSQPWVPITVCHELTFTVNTSKINPVFGWVWSVLGIAVMSIKLGHLFTNWSSTWEGNAHDYSTSLSNSSVDVPSSRDIGCEIVFGLKKREMSTKCRCRILSTIWYFYLRMLV